MYCKNCGTLLPDGIKFCPNCGLPVDNQEQTNNSQESVGQPTINPTPAPVNPVAEAFAQANNQQQVTNQYQQPINNQYQQQYSNQNVMPKKKKNVWKIIACVVIALVAIPLGLGIYESITNGSKKSITGEEFETKMKAMNYTITDGTSEIDSDESKYYDQVYFADDEGNNYSIAYVNLIDDSYAKKFFNNYKVDYQEKKTSDSIETEEDFDDYEKYALTTDNKYYVIIRIKDTIIFSESTTSYKNDINETIKKLGY